MEKKPTRAQQMAEQYAGKLDELGNTEYKPKLVRLSDTETRQQKEKLMKAREKLATFRDLIS